MKKILLLFLILLASCTLNEVVMHHGVHNLSEKQLELKVNQTNKNEIINLIGPPSSKSSYDNDVYIYIERKTSGSKLVKFGKKEIIKNDVLVLEINNKGILLAKKFYSKDEMNDVEFDENTTGIDYKKRSFIFNMLKTVREKIDDPLGKKRITN